MPDAEEVISYGMPTYRRPGRGFVSIGAATRHAALYGAPIELFAEELKGLRQTKGTIRFPLDMFPVLFAMGRAPGWLAQWQEMLLDREQKIARPRQIYFGPPQRDYVPIEKRGER